MTHIPYKTQENPIVVSTSLFEAGDSLLTTVSEHFDVSSLENAIKSTSTAIEELKVQITQDEDKYRLILIKEAITDLGKLNNFLEDMFVIFKDYTILKETYEQVAF